MRLIILFIFLISINIQAQEKVNHVYIDKVELSPSVAPLLNTKNNVGSVPVKTIDIEILDVRESRKYKEHTIHPPMKALTLSEYRQLQAQALENIDVSSEDNNK